MHFHFPEIMLPQLATLSPAGPPEGINWLHEIKLDGFRLLCRKDGDRVDFFSRRGHRWSDKLPAIAAEVRRLGARRLWLDGELVVMTEEGKSCFGSLQRALAARDQDSLAYYAFDLLYHDRRDLCSAPLAKRKAALAALVDGEAWNLRYVDHVEGSGDDFFELACFHNLEGIISKRADSVYLAGRRSKEWLKSKFRDYDRNVAWAWWEQYS